LSRLAQVAHHVHRIAHQVWAASVNPNEIPKAMVVRSPKFAQLRSGEDPTGKHHKHYNQAWF
jgi:hypothetical protein